MSTLTTEESRASREALLIGKDWSGNDRLYILCDKEHIEILFHRSRGLFRAGVMHKFLLQLTHSELVAYLSDPYKSKTLCWSWPALHACHTDL